MTCVDGRRAEDGVAPAEGQRQGCWVGETTSPRLLKCGASEHSQTYGAYRQPPVIQIQLKSQG